jgi:futalosine hydrolase
MIALLSSMPFESDHIRSSLRNVKKTRISGKIASRGRSSGKSIVLMDTGIGQVNAAHSATVIMEHFRVRLIINIGVGGACPGSGLNIGSVAVATKEIYGDAGVADSEGCRSFRKTGIPLISDGKKMYFNEFPLDRELAIKVIKSITHSSLHIPSIKAGNFITLSASSGTDERARGLEKRFKAICENMEGAALAHICRIYKIPLLEIRGISNIAGVRDKRKWNLDLASVNCQKVTLGVLPRL